MVRCRVLIVVAILLVGVPFIHIFDSTNQIPSKDEDSQFQINDYNSGDDTDFYLSTGETEEGILEPVLIEHTGSASGSSAYALEQNDVTPTPSTEVFLPAGHPSNDYSADCTGGYFLSGSGGSADFGSPAGTISLWIKWDQSAPSGRFWGQHYDFETRWSGGAMVLDWGGDGSLAGSKNDWIPNKWYFLAIVWNETSNSLAIYWGDEETSPVIDSAATLWTGSVVGLHSENDIMNSAARTSQVDGHIDDFRHFNVDRNIGNLTADYNVPLSGSEEGLTHYYKFDGDLSDSVGAQDLVMAGSSSFSEDVHRYSDSWVAEQIEINVRSINKLSVLNGTFDTGVPGTNEDWSGDGIYYPSGWLAQRQVADFRGRQRASYLADDGKYVVLENEGYLSGTTYAHYNDTRIYWYQSIDNSAGTENFTFSLNYLYQNGPLGTNFENNFDFRFEVRDGSAVLWNWTIDLVNITQRQQWYSIGPLSAYIPSAPTTFEARLVLEVNAPSGSVSIPDTDSDLDGDATNGLLVSVHIDDVSFKGEQSLNSGSVDLMVSTSGMGFVSFKEGSGISTVLINNSYWRYASIPITFSANTSISFEYSTLVSKMVRFYNSTYSTNLDSLGVSYEVLLDKSPNITLYTYVQSYPEAENLGFRVHHPSDWTNGSIEDPFGTDLTNQTLFDETMIEVPSGVVNSVGWWVLRLNSPNYGQSIFTQKFNDTSSSWEIDSLFRSGDRIRSPISIGTVDNTPVSVSDLEIKWCVPTGGSWSSEVISNGTGHLVTSTSLTFGPSNSSIGVWTVSAFWKN
ncbi:MAG: hypothetical protein ACW98Y_07360, partial [Candidatus Thorarchaeota archaeon]